MMNFNEIYKAVENLSLSSEDQIKYLKKLGTYPSVDEIVLEFDDAYIKLKGELSVKIKEIEKLNSLLNDLNKNGKVDIWEAQCLDTPPWDEIRRLSKDVLIKIKNFSGKKA